MASFDPAIQTFPFLIPLWMAASKGGHDQNQNMFNATRASSDMRLGSQGGLNTI